jgi:uncharacterized membrane protein
MARSSLQHILRDVHRIKEESIERVPHHFGLRAVVAAIFGALIFGLTFSLKGMLMQVTLAFSPAQKWIIFATILAILTAEIRFIGYSHVKNKSQRHFGQFWIKRLTTYVFVGFLVSVFLIYVYGVNNLVVSDAHLFNTIMALALPCCIGASIADLVKKY